MRPAGSVGLGGRIEGGFAYNPPVPSGGVRALRARPPGSWLIKAGSWLDRAAFKPATLPDDLVTGIALLPPVVAGLIIFRQPAARMLGVAVAAGVVGLVAARLIWREQFARTGASPLLASIFGVALIGAGAPLAIAVEITVLAVLLEVLRLRFMPAIRAQAGLIAFAVIALVTRGAPLTYFDPNGGTNQLDPIDTWYTLFFQSSTWTVDAIRPYVGNVAGPVFATSVLAVAIGVAWLAYARRVSLVVLAAFLVGSLVAINTFKWDVLFQLDSGPTWFVVGLILADRRLLPESWAVRPVLGFAVGLFGIGLRRNGYGIEAVYMAVAAIQAMMVAVAVAYWSISVAIERWRRNRRLRQREANLRVVKSI
jgi:hypothetical protein